MRINIEAQNKLVNKNSPSNTLLEYVNTPVPVISAAMRNGKANISPELEIVGVLEKDQKKLYIIQIKRQIYILSF